MKIVPATKEEIVERLKQHGSLKNLPLQELEWLAERGELRRYEEGEFIVRKGMEFKDSGLGLVFVLQGSFSAIVNRGNGPRKLMTWQPGDITGIMPFSRATATTADGVAEGRVDALSLEQDFIPAMMRECPGVVEICVHALIDRARAFNSSDWQDEKIMSLGKLAAGLAHELNNPASAVARSAKLLVGSMDEVDRAARAVRIAGLSEEQHASVDRIRAACQHPSTNLARSPLERADREDEIADWLVAHGADTSSVAALAETSVTIEALDELAGTIQGEALDAALDWVAAGSAMRMLTTEIEKASSRIYDLVAAVKGFTHLDRASVLAPIHLERGLRDTLIVLGSKARAKEVTVEIDVAPGVPRVSALPSELNQVWSNLIDNALDAVGPSGRITVAVGQVGRSVVVRVIDDGPGIPEGIRKNIYDPFFTTKEPGKGTGLGLEFARRIVRGHNGDMEFESKPGRTEFRVLLPVAEESLGSTPAAAAIVTG